MNRTGLQLLRCKLLASSLSCAPTHFEGHLHLNQKLMATCRSGDQPTRHHHKGRTTHITSSVLWTLARRLCMGKNYLDTIKTAHQDVDSLMNKVWQNHSPLTSCGAMIERTVGSSKHHGVEYNDTSCSHAS